MPAGCKSARACPAALAALLLFGTSATAADADGGREERGYLVVGGAVDPGTYNGYRRYHATCSHCHGPDGAGSSFGPSLITSPMTLDAFAAVVRDGSQSGTSGLC